MLKLGSLFSGFGGLDLAVETVFGATTAWVSDIEPGPCKVLAHRFPDAVNIGDITTVDWSTVKPVDIIAGGSPCQDISSAGRMAGMREGTRSNLWVEMREAIRVLKPTYVIWENVYAARSTPAASAMESDPGLLGDHPSHLPALRALGRVLGDLASLGYDAQWHSLRAADVGSPHGRMRYFVLAANTGREPGNERRITGTGEAQGWGALGAAARRDRAPVALLPTPRATDGTKGGPNQRGSSGDLMLPSAVALLPTPRATRGGSYALGGERSDEDRPQGEVLLPTPTAGTQSKSSRAMTASKSNGRRSGGGQSSPLGLDEVTSLLAGERPAHLPQDDDLPPRSRELVEEISSGTGNSWRPYAAAIARWEAVVGPAPSPTKPGRTGRPKLNPAFAEWMMGAPAGWITEVPGVTDNEALKMAGNGVVRQQAEAALRLMLHRMAVAA